jgi:hypothetical protein
VFKSAKSLVSLKYVGAPPPGYVYTTNFDNLWSVTFSLSTSTYKPETSDSAESGADEESDTEATSLYSSLSRDGITREEEQSDFKKEENGSLVKYFELIAYAGGLWYFITQFVFGPFSKLFTNSSMVEDLS